MRFEEEVEVPRPPEEVFAYLADIRNEPRWNPWAKQVDMLTPEPIGQGSKFRGVYKRIGTAEQALSSYEPNRRLTYTSNTMGSATMGFELSPSGSGTRIRMTGEAHPPGIMKLAEPLISGMMRRHARDLANGIRRELGGA